MFYNIFFTNLIMKDKQVLKGFKSKLYFFLALLCFTISGKTVLAEPIDKPNKSIWNDFDENDPTLQVKSKAQRQIPEKPVNSVIPDGSIDELSVKNYNPKRASEILEDVKKQSTETDSEGNSLMNADRDPAGINLESQLPLDQPLSERFASDILDPIELDVNSADILDLSLEKALLIGLDSNLPLRIVDQTVIRDKWRFWGTTSGLLPDAFSNYNMRDLSQVGTRHQNQLGISYSLAPSEIFSSLASYYDWMATSKLKGAAFQDLMRQITNQYYDVMKARGELAVRIEAVRQANIQLSLNEKLDEAGVGTRFSVLQAKEQLAENELALIAQQSNARIAEIQLLNTLNMPLGTDLRLEESQIYKKTLISPDYIMDDLVGMALANRPDITRRQFAVRAAKGRVVESIVSAVTPQLTARAMTERNDRSFTDSFGYFGDKALGLGEVGLQMPILTGMGLGQIAPINQSRALSRQASLELSNEILSVETEVRDAFLRSNAAEKQIYAAERQLEAATEAIKLARIRLQNGVGTNIDLIDTQRNYVNALVNKVRSIVQYNQSQVDQLRAIGLISLGGILDQEMAFKSGSDDNSLDDEEDEDFQPANYSGKP